MHPGESNRLIAVVALLALLIAVGAWLRMGYAINQIGTYEEIFNEFGANMPIATRAVVAVPRAVWWIGFGLLGILIAVVAVAVPDPLHRIMIQLTLAVGLLVLVAWLHTVLLFPLGELMQKLSAAG